MDKSQARFLVKVEGQGRSKLDWGWRSEYSEHWTLGSQIPHGGDNSQNLIPACRWNDLVFSTNHWSIPQPSGKIPRSNPHLKPNIARAWGVGLGIDRCIKRSNVTVTCIQVYHTVHTQYTELDIQACMLQKWKKKFGFLKWNLYSCHKHFKEYAYKQFCCRLLTTVVPFGIRTIRQISQNLKWCSIEQHDMS